VGQSLQGLEVLQSVEHGYIHVGVPKWQSFFQSPLKLVPKVKVSCLNLNEVEGGEAPNKKNSP
jgi:hypothetical protein